MTKFRKDEYVKVLIGDTYKNQIVQIHAVEPAKEYGTDSDWYVILSGQSRLLFMENELEKVQHFFKGDRVKVIKDSEKATFPLHYFIESVEYWSGDKLGYCFAEGLFFDDEIELVHSNEDFVASIINTAHIQATPTIVVNITVNADDVIPEYIIALARESVAKAIAEAKLDKINRTRSRL